MLIRTEPKILDPKRKAVVDKHFTDNYKYYRKVCYQYYGGRYLLEDLLHEVYLGFMKIRPELIDSFNQINKRTGLNNLKNLGLLIIRSLYQKRFYKKKYERGSDSPLSEMNGIEYFGDGEGLDPFYDIGIEDETFEDEVERRSRERKLDTMNALITANKEHRGVKLLLLCTNNTTKDVAKESGTSPYHIKKEIDQTKEYFKQIIA